MASKAKLDITAVIIARNAERTIEACVKSLGFCTSVVVGVNDSHDRTAEYARRTGAKVQLIPWEGYGQTKNRLIEKVRSGWVLSVDSDECVSPELAASLAEVVRAPEPLEGYWISRRNHFLGQEIRHCGWTPDWQLRFFRAGRGAFSLRHVHEALEVEGRLGHLRGMLDHYSYATCSEYLQRLNTYTSLAARDRVERGKRASWVRLGLDPGWTFFKMYVIKAGWRDGFPGLALCALSALNTLIKHAKVWELSQHRHTR